MPQLKTTAKAQYNQNKTNIVSSNHLPVLPGVVPYCVMLIKIVPRLISHAGTNRLSVGWVMEARKVEG